MQEFIKRRALFPWLAGAFLVAGCKDGAAPASKPAAASSKPVTMEAIGAEAQGFNVGSTMSARTIYVFFDAQCPHCAALWLAAKPLRSQARFVWIPVGVVNAASTAQGATLLAAPDPVAAMDQHEASLSQKGGGISASGAAEAQKAAVKKNTDLMTKFGFASVPTVVARHAQSGEVVTIEGSVPTSVLAQRLGLQGS